MPDLILTAYYEIGGDNNMVQVKFSGLVSAQVATGETVTVTVTKPDLTTEVLTALTLADRTYSVTKTYTVAGSYSAKAHGNADAQYEAWDSSPVPFTVALEPRTGTLVVAMV